MPDEILISFACKKCGTKLDWFDDATDDTVLVCKNCGEHFGTYADLRHTALEAARARVDKILKHR